MPAALRPEDHMEPGLDLGPHPALPDKRMARNADLGRGGSARPQRGGSRPRPSGSRRVARSGRQPVPLLPPGGSRRRDFVSPLARRALRSGAARRRRGGPRGPRGCWPGPARRSTRRAARSASRRPSRVFSLLNHAIVADSLPPKVRDRLQKAAADFAPGDLSHRALQARARGMTPGLYQQ